MEVNGKVGAIGSLYPEVLDELRSVLLNIRVLGHQKIDKNFDGRTTICGRNCPLQLKVSCAFRFVVTLSHQLVDQICILTILKRFCVQTEIHIQRADMGIVGVLQTRPWHRAANDRELATKAGEDLTYFDEDRFWRSRGAVVTVVGRLSSLRNYRV